jgi:hypothetical protein
LRWDGKRFSVEVRDVTLPVRETKVTL